MQSFSLEYKQLGVIFPITEDKTVKQYKEPIKLNVSFIFLFFFNLKGYHVSLTLCLTHTSEAFVPALS